MYKILWGVEEDVRITTFSLSADLRSVVLSIPAEIKVLRHDPHYSDFNGRSASKCIFETDPDLPPNIFNFSLTPDDSSDTTALYIRAPRQVCIIPSLAYQDILDRQAGFTRCILSCLGQVERLEFWGKGKVTIDSFGSSQQPATLVVGPEQDVTVRSLEGCAVHCEVRGVMRIAQVLAHGPLHIWAAGKGTVCIEQAAARTLYLDSPQARPWYTIPQTGLSQAGVYVKSLQYARDTYQKLFTFKDMVPQERYDPEVKVIKKE